VGIVAKKATATSVQLNSTVPFVRSKLIHRTEQDIIATTEYYSSNNTVEHEEEGRANLHKAANPEQFTRIQFTA
jgi:hypothetical protein